MLLTLFVIFGVSEKKKQNQKEDEITIGMSWKILKDVALNQKVQCLLSFIFLKNLANAVYNLAGRVYLTSDLNYDAATLSQIKVVCTPISILMCSRYGYLAK